MNGPGNIKSRTQVQVLPDSNYNIFINQATPNVFGLSVAAILADTPITVTNILGGVQGQQLRVISNAFVTLEYDAGGIGSIFTATGANVTLEAGKIYTFTYLNEIWYESASTNAGATLASLTPGDYLSGGIYDGSTPRTWNVLGATANIPSYLVARDAGGDIYVGDVNATSLLSPTIDYPTPITIGSSTNVTIANDLTVGGNLTQSGITANLSQLATGNATVNIGSGSQTLGAFLRIRRAAGQYGQLVWTTGATVRWAAYIDNTAESGSNAGGEWSLAAHDDAGTFIDNVIRVQRFAGGTMNLARPINHSGTSIILAGSTTTSTVNVGTGTGSGGTSLDLRRAAGQAAGIYWRSGTSARWRVYVTETAESGGNAGSNLFWQAFDDAGAFIDNWMTVTRAAGGSITISRPTTFSSTISASNLSGTNTGDQTITLTGDVTGSGTGSFTATIAAQAVTYAKIQNVAANSFLANATGSAATVQEIATNRIPLFASAITGTPSATTYLRGDGSWATVSGSGDVVGPASATDNAIVRFDSTTGKLVQNSAITLSDAGAEIRLLFNSGSIPFIGINTADGSDTEALILGAGSSSASLADRGASIVLRGNEEAFSPGQLSLATGLIAGSISSLQLTADPTLSSSLSARGRLQLTSDIEIVINDAGANSDTRIEGDTLTHAFLLDAGQDSLGLFTSSIPNFQTGRGIAYIANATTVPTGNPTTGVFAYSDGGNLKVRNSVGAIATVGNGYTSIVKSANQDVTNAGVTNDTEFFFSVTAGQQYAVQMELYISGSDTTGDYTMDFRVDAGTIRGKGTCQNLTGAAAVQNIIITAAAAANTTAIVTGAPTANLDDLVAVRVGFAFTASNTTTFRFRFGNAAAAAGRTSRTWKGSVMRWKSLN